jgi:hypothetical protein
MWILEWEEERFWNLCFCMFVDYVCVELVYGNIEFKLFM